MPRLARVIAVGVPHHITQRGKARRFILQDEADRKVYLDLLRQSTELHGVALIGYCLMSNHVRLVAVPRKADALARALKENTRPVCFLPERTPPLDGACCRSFVPWSSPFAPAFAGARHFR
jgi:REP element-mobilizing transposase RayT